LRGHQRLCHGIRVASVGVGQSRAFFPGRDSLRSVWVTRNPQAPWFHRVQGVSFLNPDPGHPAQSPPGQLSKDQPWPMLTQAAQKSNSLLMRPCSRPGSTKTLQALVQSFAHAAPRAFLGEALSAESRLSQAARSAPSFQPALSRAASGHLSLMPLWSAMAQPNGVATTKLLKRLIDYL
jgi:hypothetical protein